MRKLTAIALLSLVSASAAANNEALGSGIPLQPSETIVQMHVVPTGPIIRIPFPHEIEAQRARARRSGPPPLEIDRVTKRPRNQSGWSGDMSPPAATACFPAC